MTTPTVRDQATRDRLAEALRHALCSGSPEGVGCSCGWFGPGREHKAHADAARLATVAELIRALADDYLGKFDPEDGPVTVTETYEWLTTAALRAPREASS